MATRACSSQNSTQQQSLRMDSSVSGGAAALFTSPLDLVREQNNQITDLKDQYLRLREQLEQEQKEATAKLLDLHRELRSEQQQLAELEEECAGRKRRLSERRSVKSKEAIEEIWQMLQFFRENIKQGRAMRA
jgi:DNA gyrase/topoisomerase IV subunit A